MFNRLAALICRYPIGVLIVALILAAACLALAATRLGFQSNRNDLLSRDLEWNRRFIDWMEKFPGADDLIVVVESDPTDDAKRARAVAFIEDLVPRLQADPDINEVEWGAPRGEYTAKAARLAPLDRFVDWIDQAERAVPVLESDSAGDLMRTINQRLVAMSRFGGPDADAPPDQIAESLDKLTDLVRAIRIGFAAPHEAPAAFQALLTDSASETWRYLESPNGRLMFVQVGPRARQGTVNPSARAIVATRAIIDEVRARHPGVEAGLTGVEVVDSDETAAASRDSALASAIALVLIAALLIGAFHSLRVPLILVGTLLVGVAWSFGFLVLAVGHLQVLSVVFIVVLLGLGVDFGIHLTATYEEMRREFPDGADHFQPALAETMRLSGPGITTGALTTAAAFATTAFTDFKGVAEMGIIAAGGVALCLGAMLTVFPAMLRLFRHSHRHVRPLEDRPFQIFRESWIMPVCRRPWWALGIATVVVALGAWQALHVRFVYDLLALQPRGVESVEWQHRIITDGDVSIYFGVSVTDDLDEARRRKELFLRKPTVASVGGIGLIFPDDEAEKLELIREARAVLMPALEHALSQPDVRAPHRATTLLTTQLANLERMLGQAESRSDTPAGIGDAMSRLRSELQQTVELYRSLAPEDRIPRVVAIDDAYLAMRDGLAAHLLELLDESPLAAADLPASIMRPYVDRTDPDRPRYSLHVYPRLPKNAGVDNPLAPQFLPYFVRDLTEVDPDVTGSVTQIQYSGALILDSYVRAGITALLVVFLLVLFNFGSAADTVLALLPVALSFTLTFAIMALLSVHLNPANMMVLPLLFGIGVDSGIHTVHRARMSGGERPIGLTHGTGKGIMLTSLTTMIGFATMMIARHRGVASLGFVLTVGIGLSTLACLIVLPALLEIVQRHRERRGAAR